MNQTKQKIKAGDDVKWYHKLRFWRFEGEIKPGWESFKMIIFYLLVGTLWILWSDQWLSALVDDQEALTQLQTYKGWFYVFVSGAIFYIVLRGRLKTISIASKRIESALVELQKNNDMLEQTQNQLSDQNQLLEDKIAELQILTNRYQLAVEGSNDAIWEYDGATELYRVSKRWMNSMGYDFDEADADTWLQLVQTEHRDYVEQALFNYFYRRGKPLSIEYQFKKANGELIWLFTKGTAQWDEFGRFVRAAGSHTDVSESHRLHEQLYQQAYYDDVTHLPNRVYFEQMVKKEMASLSKEDSLALVYFDIDDFKFVNELLGHSVGDQLINMIAQRVLGILDEKPIFAKVSGDGFALTLRNNHSEYRKLLKKIELLTEALREPYELVDQSLFISVSSGISIYPKDAQTFEDLFKNADAAMVLAKEKGKNNYQFYTDEIHEARVLKIQMIHHLHRAIESNEMSLVYQPIYNMETMEVVGFEALVRWYNEQFKAVSPNVFIPYAEGTGLIKPLEEWIFDQVFSQVAKWRTLSEKIYLISINLSTKGLMNPDFILFIEKLHAIYDIQPGEIQIEVTETSMVSNADIARRHMHRLSLLNVRIALDDFGTGYSSLDYLHQLPIKTLKIDRSFIGRILHPSQDEPVLQLIIDLAHKLNMKIVAEGVETENQMKYLLSNQCLFAQGYYLNRPMKLSDVEKIIENNKKTVV